MLKFLKKIWRDERGQTLSEYALLAALIAVATITAITAFQDQLEGVFRALGNALRVQQ